MSPLVKTDNWSARRERVRKRQID